jgi:hypothetical protein
MNLPEVHRLCRIIGELAPAQKFTEDTPVMWEAVLADVTLADALEALKAIAKRQPFIAPSDICAEVGAMRRARLQHSVDADGLLPNVDPDDVASWAIERRAILAAAAAGVLNPEAYTASGQTLSGVPAMNAVTGEPRPDAVRRAIAAGVRLPPMPRPATTNPRSKP